VKGQKKVSGRATKADWKRGKKTRRAFSEYKEMEEGEGALNFTWRRPLAQRGRGVVRNSSPRTSFLCVWQTKGGGRPKRSLQRPSAVSRRLRCQNGVGDMEPRVRAEWRASVEENRKRRGPDKVFFQEAGTRLVEGLIQRHSWPASYLDSTTGRVSVLLRKKNQSLREEEGSTGTLTLKSRVDKK